MGTLASGSIDLKSLKIAGEGASKYITKISDGGITIHDSQNQELDYLKLTSESMDIYKNNASIAQFSSSIRIGIDDGQKFMITPKSIFSQNADGSSFFSLNPSGASTDAMGEIWNNSSNINTSATYTGVDMTDELTTYKIECYAVGYLDIDLDGTTSYGTKGHPSLTTTIYQTGGDDWTQSNINITPNPNDFLSPSGTLTISYTNNNDPSLTSLTTNYSPSTNQRTEIHISILKTKTVQGPVTLIGNVSDNIEQYNAFTTIIGRGLKPSRTTGNVTIGTFNDGPETDALFVIGKGTGEDEIVNGETVKNRSDAFIVDINGNTEVAGTMQVAGALSALSHTGLYKIITATKTKSDGMSANSYQSSSTVALTTPKGFNAVGVVGYTTSHWRFQPFAYRVDSNTQLTTGLCNWSASNVTGSQTITFYVLCLKATSA